MYSNVENYRNDFSDLSEENTFLYHMKYEWRLVFVYVDKAYKK